MPCTSAILTGDASAKDIDTAMKLGAGKDHVLIIFFVFVSFKLIAIVIGHFRHALLKFLNAVHKTLYRV